MQIKAISQKLKGKPTMTEGTAYSILMIAAYRIF